MVATRAEIEQFRVSQQDLSRFVERDLNEFFAVLPSNISAEQLRDLLIEFNLGLVDQYGNIAAVLAAEFYTDTLGGRALLAPAVPVAQIEAATRFAVAPVFTANPDQAAVMKRARTFAARMIRNQAGETIKRSTTADPRGAGWARVPSGGETCAWCKMLASRGFVYASKDTARGKSRDHYHADCDCVAVPALRGDKHPYHAEVDKMYKQYQSVHETGDTDDQVAAKLREKYGFK